MDGSVVLVCLCLSFLYGKSKTDQSTLLKFSGSVQLCTSNFWARVLDQPAYRVQPMAQNSLFFFQILSPLVFLFCRVITYLFEP